MIAGCATEEQKEKVILWLQFVSKGFAGSVVEKIKPVKYDVQLGVAGATNADPDTVDPPAVTKSGTLVCDLVIGDGSYL